jgi:hypothetical protein
MIERKCIILPFLLLVLVMVLISGCTTPIESNGNAVQNASIPNERVEIYHFHMTQQCYSCKTVGAYAEETINTFFAAEVATGKVVFAHVNVELPENKELVERYGATGSSLWIGVYDENGFHKEQNINVWYKIKDQNEYMTYLKEVVDKRLAGDFS